MLAGKREGFCEVSFLPLHPTRLPIGICEVIAGIAIGQNRQWRRTLGEHVDLRPAIAQGRSEKRSVTENGLFRDRKEVAMPFEIRSYFLWIESVQTKVANFLGEDGRNKF